MRLKTLKGKTKIIGETENLMTDFKYWGVCGSGCASVTLFLR